MQFATDDLHPRERLDLWRDMITRKLLRLAIDPLSEQPFGARASMRAQHGLSMGVGRLSPSVSHRTHDIVAADNDDVVLFVNLSGRFVLTRGDHDLSLGDGDASLIDCNEPCTLIRLSAGDTLCIRMPRAALSEAAPDLDAAVGRLIPADTDPLRLLMTYVRTLNESADMAFMPEASRLIVDHVRDLSALTLGAARASAWLSESGGLRAARLKAIKAYIGAHIGPRPIAIEDVAAHQRISARYVRKLFEADGASFTTYVTEQRLARAHALLIHPQRGRRPISDIAYAVGFGDLSYFNRTFRKRFDATPSEVRAEAAREGIGVG